MGKINLTDISTKPPKKITEKILPNRLGDKKSTISHRNFVMTGYSKKSTQLTSIFLLIIPIRSVAMYWHTRYEFFQRNSIKS